MFPLIVLAGPTASGKSEAAIALAEYLDSEIISADSLQVYKYFDIGTAKPSREARQRVAHHLVDILEPDVEFTAFDFKVRALACAREIASRGKIPIVVGGTGLYLKVLTQDFDCAVQVSTEIRDRVKAEMRLRGTESMHVELAGVDPIAASRISPTDPLRIERALTVYYETGRRFSDFQAAQKVDEREFEEHYCVFGKERKRLYADIDHRVDTMMQMGLRDEVAQLLDRGFAKNLKPFQSIGYTQMIDHLEGNITLDRAVYEIKRDTRHYAKRQMTWFKKVAGTYPVPVELGDTPLTLRDKILTALSAGVGSFLVLLLLVAGVPASAGTYDDALSLFGKRDYVKALNHFQVVRKSLPNSNESKQALYMIGQTHMATHDYQSAIEAFNASLSEYPEIEDYILLDLANSYFAVKGYAEALEAATHLMEKFPQSRLIPQAELFRSDVLSQMAQGKNAIVFLKKAIDRYSQKPRDSDFASYLPQMIYKIAVLMEAEHQSKEAYAFYRELFVNYPSHSLTAKSERSLKRLGDELHSPVLSEEEISTRVQSLLSEVHYQQAIDEISHFKEREKGVLTPRFYFYLANAYQGLRQRASANEVLLAYLKGHPQHARVHEANFLVARNYWNLGQIENGISYFQKVVDGNSDWSIKAEYYLGKLYEDEKKYDLARKSYAHLASLPANHDFKETAAWRLAWTFYKTGDYAQAFEKFKHNAEQISDGKLTDNNIFWMGKSAKKLAKDVAARDAFVELYNSYPYSYYGLRAKEILLKQNMKESVVPVAPKEDAEERPIHLTAEERFHYVRAREMIEMNMAENVRNELRQLEKSVQKNQTAILWLSNLYNRAGIYSESFRLLNMLKDLMSGKREKDFPAQFWRNLYPPAYADSIRFSSRNHHVDPFLVRGVIHQESMFDAKALSRAGARGLMQLMPETGKRLALSLNEQKPFVPEALFDPEVNIKLGVRYLSELLKNTGNNPAHVLISYNAGPDVLKKWLQQFQNLEDEDEFLESIPYQETRLYVRRVLRNYGIYKALYPDGAENHSRHEPF